MDRRQSTRGQSAIEFALLLAGVTLLLLASVDMARAFGTYVVITNAAREGAHYGSTHPFDHGGIRQRAISEAQGSGTALQPGNISISTSGASGSSITVTVSYSFSLLSVSPKGMGTLDLHSSAEMAVF
jgi:hypothetical protein